ncbi:MAG: Fe-S protein assembly co-chaperone HscB, partial [Alphaproteobacteria bacterium]
MNYFKLLGIGPAYEIGYEELEQAYFAAQRQYHPDRFAGKPETERSEAMQRSVDINNAYNVLKNPLLRARYLLRQQGIMVGTDSDTVKPSQELLMEVMQWREEGGLDVREQVESIQRIAKFYREYDFNAMAEETLRLGYI